MSTIYCVRADLEEKFGEDNIAKWADLQSTGDEDAIEARIDKAIVVATAQVDDALRGGPVDVPLTGTPPTSIVDHTATLAAVWLYTNRGSADSSGGEEDMAGKLSGHRKEAKAFLASVRNGQTTLDYPTVPSIPTVVAADPVDVHDDAGR